MNEQKCRVVKRNITADEAVKILELQRDAVLSDQPMSDESAMSKALEGSKIYLKCKGLIT